MSRSTATKTQLDERRGDKACVGPEPSQPFGVFGGSEVLAFQRAIGNHALGQLLAGAKTQPRPANSAPPMVQAKEANGQPASPSDRTQEPPAPEPTTPARRLIVEDDAEQIQSGQMRKSDFLAELRTAVCSAAQQALAGTMWSAMGCPYIERWLGHYSNQSSEHLERALRKYAPETATATTAQQYIPIVSERVRRGIAQWRETGEVSGVPEDMAEEGMPEPTLEGLVGSGLSAIGSAIGSGLSSIGRALFKARPGGPSQSEDPATIQSDLGSGHPLDGTVRTRMESAFGVDFSGVRTHTDAKAQELSGRFNARAFTVGENVAFGAGEYQPGTVIGDALIAHELAHVIQQASGKTNGTQTKSAAAYGALEEDADSSAVGAIARLWGGMKGLKSIGQQAMPRLKSGLRLQGCSRKEEKKTPNRFEEIKKILNSIPTGKEALKIMDDYKVSVQFTKGSYYYDPPPSNTMFLDSDHDIARSALDFVHEMHHAKSQNTGLTPDIHSLPRATYVQKMVEEEAEGTVKSIEAKLELTGTRIDVSTAIFPLEDEYKAAYKTAVDSAKAASPATSDEQLRRIGRQAGLTRVIKGFTDGEVLTSTTTEPYPDYYGRMWDEAHAGGH